MPIEPVKIPQNVYIEDRIIGPVTLRQIIIIAIGGGFSYIIFGSLQKALGTVPIPLAIIAWIPAAIAAIFAMVKVNDLSITRILLLVLEASQKPSKRTWAPRTGISINFRTSGKIVEEKPKKTAAPAIRPETQIEELSTAMDRLWKPAPTMIPTPPPAEEHKREPVTTEFALPNSDTQETKKDGDLSDLSVFRDIFPPSSSPSHDAP